MVRGKILILAGVLGGCATQAEQAAVAPGGARDLPQLARMVAAQLDAASHDSARLAAVELELRRISDVLPAAAIGRPPAQSAAVQPAAAAAGTDDGSGQAALAAHEALREQAFGGVAQPQPQPQAPAPSASDGETPAGYAPPPVLEGGRSLFAALTLGRYPNADSARTAWFGVSAVHGAALAELGARMEVVEREEGGQSVVLKVGPLASNAAAEALCAQLREVGTVCGAGDFTGEPL